MYKDPTKIYRETRATSSVSGASPHQLVEILFDACQEKLAEAKGAMQRGDVKSKAEAIKKAVDIIVGLQASLNFDKGGAIAVQLDDLYTFCTNRLALANALNDSGKIDEVYRVIAEIKLGWMQIKGAP
jgi:flagellar protein FliS